MLTKADRLLRDESEFNRYDREMTSSMNLSRTAFPLQGIIHTESTQNFLHIFPLPPNPLKPGFKGLKILQKAYCIDVP